MLRTRIRIGVVVAAVAAFGSLGIASPALASTCNEDFLGPDVEGEGEACRIVLDAVNGICARIGGGPCFG
ncbi:MAG: hypothetical protein M3217_00690 [Actinomycetota bacterium]|nr:hypothetical protein [Actinomycetota bacterium]